MRRIGEMYLVQKQQDQEIMEEWLKGGEGVKKLNYDPLNMYNSPHGM